MRRYKTKKINGKCIDEHRLIMEEHLGRELDRRECVHHKNGDGQDNRLDNLELISLSNHSRLHMNGEGNSSARLTRDQVKVILDSPVGASALAREYGVAKKTIQDIKHRRTWKYLYGPPAFCKLTGVI